jgi:glycosyltransferase involved in cell wall biosynthesis
LGGFLHRLARELPEHGFSIHVLAPLASGSPKEEVRDGVSIHRFPHPGGGIVYTGEMHRAALRHPLRFAGFLHAYRIAVRTTLREKSPAIVHAHWWFPSGWIAAPLLDESVSRFILSIHGTDIRLLNRFPPAAALAGSVFRRAERVLPVSDFLGSKLDQLGIRGGARIRLPMPADGDQFTPPPSRQERRDFVLAARLVRQKRVDVAIRGLAHARTLGTDARLHILGDGPERESLAALAHRLGCNDSVRFHGFQPPDKLAEWFRSALAVVLTSEEEGYGLVLVEGALCGTPGIGVRSGAIPENIVDGKSGWLTGPGDWKGVGKAMHSAAAEPPIAAARGLEARERALGATAKPLARKLADIYREILRAR